ncbi:MAG: hypothetical protein FWE20_08970 [Defluviitaleaceae bacterium]|nr:hypothetical protein [Defluviitaleaceae bacterium]
MDIMSVGCTSSAWISSAGLARSNRAGNIQAASRPVDRDLEPEKTLSEAFARAVSIWQERMRKGMNSLTDEEIEARVEGFRASITPLDPTKEELAKIEVLTQRFRLALIKLNKDMYHKRLRTCVHRMGMPSWRSIFRHSSSVPPSVPLRVRGVVTS